MSAKHRGWTRNIAVLGGFEMVFAGVAAVGIFITAAGLGVTNGAVALALTAALLLVTGFVLLRTTSHHGGLLDARRTTKRRLQYRDRYRS